MKYISPLKPGLELLNDKARLIKDLQVIFISYYGLSVGLALTYRRYGIMFN